MASSSSMKMIAGAFSLARANASLTILAPSPMNICSGGTCTRLVRLFPHSHGHSFPHSHGSSFPHPYILMASFPHSHGFSFPHYHDLSFPHSHSLIPMGSRSDSSSPSVHFPIIHSLPLLPVAPQSHTNYGTGSVG